MASTIPFQLVFPTELVDLIDAAWMGDITPQDDDPLPPGVTLPPDDLDDFGGLGSVLSLGRGGGGGGGVQGHGAGGTGGATAAAAAGNNEAWQDLALGELQ